MIDAFSSFLVLKGDVTFATHPLVWKSFKVASILKPSKPRYLSISKVNVIPDYLKHVWPVQRLSLKDLTLKTVILLALISH